MRSSWFGAASALDSAEGESADDPLLEQEGDGDDRQGVEHRQRGHGAPLKAELGLEVGDHDRRGLGLDGGQQQGEQELVPGREEREQCGDGDATVDSSIIEIVTPGGVFATAIDPRSRLTNTIGSGACAAYLLHPQPEIDT